MTLYILTCRWQHVLCFVVLLFSLAGAPALAQKGNIVGTLVDAETGETLIGANAIVAGTAVGTATDLDGRYEIKNLDPGTYTLNFTYIGYNPTTVTGVEVVAGEATRIDLGLSPEAVGLDEVVVEATALQNTEAALLAQRQKASAISDAISAEAISRSGSGDAAAAMTKVTGASMVDGKYVYVRGLGDRYTSATLNGSKLPSADPDRNSFQLDLFPSSLLDNIVTLKTFMPDKPGDFSGGLVDVGTKAFPDDFTIQFSTSVSYDSEASFANTFLSFNNASNEWLGFDGNAYRIPDAIRNMNGEVPDPNDAQNFQLTNEERAAAAAELDRVSKSFANTFSPVRESAPMNYGMSGAIGGTTSLFKKQLGYTASLTYSRNYSYRDQGTFGRWQLLRQGSDLLVPNVFFGDPNDLVEGSASPDEKELGNFTYQNGVDEVNWGGSVSVTYRPHPNHKIGTTFLRTQIGTQEALLLAGFRDQSDQSTFVTNTLHYTERNLTTAQLRGESFIRPARVEWKAALNQTRQEEPDLRYFSSQININSQGDTTFTLPSANATEPTRFFRDLNEGSASGNLDVTIPLRQWSGLSMEIKVGGAADITDRRYRQRRFQYLQGQSQQSFNQLRGNTTAYFNQAGIADTVTTVFGGEAFTFFRFGPYINEASAPRDNYDADRTIASGYGMIELPITRKLRLIGGARMETTDLTVESLDMDLADSLRVGEISELDVLPSLNAVYQIGNNMNVRLAATRTLARPTFRELAPFQSFDFVGGFIVVGNPQLDRTLITNFDTRWEWFVRPGELLAISGFYKQFDNPIERVIRAQGEGQFITFQNVDKAEVFGLEFEARKRLDNVIDAPILRHIQLGGNLSLVESRVDIPEDELIIIRQLEEDPDTKRQLVGQSPFLLNLDATYENFRSGTAVSLLYNVFGERLSTVTRGATPDVFEQPRPQLDLTASQRLLNNLKLKISAQNLLGTDFKETQTFKGQEYIFLRYNRAQTFSVSASYEF